MLVSCIQLRSMLQIACLATKVPPPRRLILLGFMTHSLTHMPVAVPAVKRISFNQFTTFGTRVTAITFLMSSIYLALWLYVDRPSSMSPARRSSP